MKNSTVTTERGDNQHNRKGSIAKVKSAEADNNEVTTEDRGEQSIINSTVTTELGDNQHNREGSNAKVKSETANNTEVTTEQRDEQSNGWEENNSTVTTELGDNQHNYRIEVTTEHRGEKPIKEEAKHDRITTVENQRVIKEDNEEVSVPKNNNKLKIMKLKPPTYTDDPNLKRKNNKNNTTNNKTNNRKRKFIDDQSTPKINTKFLSVDKERLSDSPLNVQRCTDSLAGKQSTGVQRGDAIKPSPSGAGRITCQISDHAKPDLALSSNMISLSK